MKNLNLWYWAILLALTTVVSKFIYFAMLDAKFADDYAVTIVALVFGLAGLFLGSMSKKV